MAGQDTRAREEAGPLRGPRPGHVLATAGGLLLLWALGGVVLLVAAGLILAVGLDGLASGFARRTALPRWLGLGLVILAFVGGLAAVVLTVVPQVAGEFDALQQSLDLVIGFAVDWYESLGVPQEVIEDAAEEGQARMADLAGALAGHVAAFGMTTVGVLASLVVMLAIAVFASADPGLYRRGALALVPPARRAQAMATLAEIGGALRWWFVSQFVSMSLLGVTVALGLYLLGIELWLSLALLAALFTFVPYLGPVLAGIPIVAVGFAAGVETGLAVLAFYVVIQNLEGMVIVPLVQQKAVRLPPALAIGAQLLLGFVFGPAGFILAAPITVVGMVATRKLYVEPMERAALAATRETPQNRTRAPTRRSIVSQSARTEKGSLPPHVPESVPK